MSGTIPTELGLLESLHTLNLKSNSLSGTVPTELDLIRNLQSLYLSGNPLTGTLPVQTWKRLGEYSTSTNPFANLPDHIVSGFGFLNQTASYILCDSMYIVSLY